MKKKNKKKKPAVSIHSSQVAFRQICNLIPAHLVPKLAREAGAESLARTFSYWSFVVSMLYSQFVHSWSLNDLCDGLGLQAGYLATIRGATPPRRNTFSHAGKNRPASIAEALFWAVQDALMKTTPSFGSTRSFKGLAGKFRRAIYVLDSTTISLVLNCIDWAQHRRRKAAAKTHMRLGLHSFLPNVVTIDSAKGHDSTKARSLCAGIKPGEIVIFDKAYVHFIHLAELCQRGIFWVSRAKANMNYRVRKKFKVKAGGAIISDESIELTTPSVRKQYGGEKLRRVVARVKLAGRDEPVEMTFITNNMEWSPATIADLYRCRWTIEVFFKQIKQTLQLNDFIGHSANAVKWQIWMALLVYLLLRYISHISRWCLSFSRLMGILRAGIWRYVDIIALLKSYGTAGGSFKRMIGTPQDCYFPGFASG